MTVFEKISELQEKLDKDSSAWLIGEQLKEICSRDPACGPILLEDLQNPGMGLAAADKKLYDYGKSIAKGKRGVGIGPQTAERILREFYGLPESGTVPQREPVKAAPESMVLDFRAFLG